MKTTRTAITFILIFLLVSALSGVAASDEGKKLEKSKRPYADVKVLLYGAEW